MWKLKTSRTHTPEVRSYIEKSFHKLMARDDIGFKDLDLLKESIQFCEEQKSFYDNKKKMVVIGFGGSSLGAKALCQALYPQTWQDKIIFFDNVDSNSIDSFLETVDSPQDYAWAFISKSGGTIEVLSLLDYCYQYFQETKNISIIDNTVVITEDKPSPAKNFVDEHKVCFLPVPKNVGGRFSVLTPVGLFPLGFLGLSFDKVLSSFEKALSETDLIFDVATQLYESIGKDELLFYGFHYSDRMGGWSSWLQQLWAESLAKKEDRKGNEGPLVSTFIPCRGTSDQHSVLQQIMQGREKKFVMFTRVESSENGRFKIKKSLTGNDIMLSKSIGDLMAAEAHATEQALNEVQIETLSLKTTDINEESMVSLILLWMLVVGTLGEAFDINAFNQPGVESGKTIARRVLSASH